MPAFPLTRPVAGIAMGLIKEGDRFAVLSDILGDEDHLGDMDFKVAGTETASPRCRWTSRSPRSRKEIMQTALTQAQDGRMHILGEMAKATWWSPRPASARHGAADQRDQHPSGQDRRGHRAGRQGDPRDHRDHRRQDRRGLTSSPEVGQIYTGKVVRVVDFGAFVNILGQQDGLCHISELKNERVGKVTDVVNEGDTVKVKVLNIDDRGKIKLSMRVVDQETGEELEAQPRPPRSEGGEGGDDRGDRGPRRQRRAG